jgi:Protein of unknown function (DUF2971)
LRLYYMTAEKWGPVILRDRRLKISRLEELNDPFELLGASIGEAQMRWIMETLHEHWSNTLGMSCLSNNWHSPLMWAHYAEKNHGVCFGFDVSDRPELINKMDYTPDRLSHALQRTDRLLGVNRALLVQILTTKYVDWSYEHEYRLFTDLRDREPDGNYYFDFGPDVRLREVILGARCGLTPKLMASEIKNSPASVEIFKARPAFDSFRIVRDESVPAVTVVPS